MPLFRDLKVFLHLFLSPIRGRTHAERLNRFYGPQADGYDATRARFLQGRRELYERLPTPESGVWYELGGGTGANLEHLSDRLRRLDKVYIVDLSKGLLDAARRRIADRGWANVEAVEADVTAFAPPRLPADVVTFSYSLTMIPDWFAAIDRAWGMLRPGGAVGVVDFYVSRKHPEAGFVRHPWSARVFWPLWFNPDDVFPSPDHVPYLHRRFEAVHFSEHRARVGPLRMPYYLFVGRKPGGAAP
jgi:S-adenosylmethionine-diacylgycerolhomoserine-N-methlytransferase